MDSDLCTFCNTEKETLEHLFYDCYVTKHFLSDFCDWVLTKLNLHLGLSKQNVLFGIPLNKSNRTVNWILLHLKKIIYFNRTKNSSPSFVAFRRYMEGEINVQKFLLLKNGKFNEYNNLWKPWLEALAE